MKIVSLRVNGYDIDGLDNATVKITLNNISPVTMTGTVSRSARRSKCLERRTMTGRS